MADDLQDKSEVVDLQEDSSTEDGLVNKRNTRLHIYISGNIWVYSLTIKETHA